MYSSRDRDAAAAMLASGVGVSGVSRALGVNRSTIRQWRDHPEHPGRHECPQCDGSKLNTAAYASLLGFYLGDGCISIAARSRILRVSCDAKYPKIVAEVHAAISGVRPKARIHHVKAPGVIVVQSAWMHWPCVLPQDGDGPKHLRSLMLMDWQSAIVEAHPAAFLQGLFHSDGCRATNTVHAARTGSCYTYARWQFSNRSEDLHAMCQSALDRVGVSWRRSSRWATSVSKRDAVARLDELIGLKS